MVRREFAIDADTAITAYQIEKAPAKAEGASMKALLFKGAQFFHTVTPTWSAGANTYGRCSVYGTIPTRWSDVGERTTPATLSTALIAPFGGINIPLYHKIFYWSCPAASANPSYASEDEFSRAPVLLPVETLEFTWARAGIALAVYILVVEYDWVDVDEFTWERLLAEAATRS